MSKTGGGKVSQKSSNVSDAEFPITPTPTTEEGLAIEVYESFDMFRSLQNGALSNTVIRVKFKAEKPQKNASISMDDKDYHRVSLFEEDDFGEFPQTKNEQKVDQREKFGLMFQQVEYDASRALRRQRLKLSEIQEVVLKKKDLLMGVYSFKSGGTYYCKFENAHDFSTFQNYLSMLNVLSGGESSTTNQKSTGGFSTGGASFSTGISNLRKESGVEFYKKKTNQWNVSDIMEWLKHIFYQDLLHGTEPCEVINLHEKLTKIGELKAFESFLESTKTKGWIIKHLEELFLPKKKKNEEEDDDDEGEEGEQQNDIEKNPNHPLRPIYKHQTIRNTLERELEFLKENKDFFPYSFYIVLRKRVQTKSRPMKDKNNPKKVRMSYPDLIDLIRFLRYVKRSWWDVEECTFEIAFLLLFNVGLYQYVEGKEIDFEDYKMDIKNEEREKKRILEEEGIENDPNFKEMTFSDILEQFNKENGCNLEWISFDLFVKRKVNFILEEIRAKKKEKEKLHGATKELEDKYKKFKIQVTKYQKLMSLGGNFSNMFKLAKKREEDAKKALDKAMEEKNPEMFEIDKQISVLCTKLNDFKEMDEDEKIRDELRNSFLKHPERKKEIIRMVKDALENWKKKNPEANNFILTVKLILGKLLTPPGKVHQMIAKYVLPVVGGDFYKFGFVHASITIKNLQLHWFNSSLVHFKELSKYDRYHEFFACDVDCPLICDFGKFYERIERLSETIIQWNTNYEYSAYNIKLGGIVIGGKNKMNCQQFTLNVLKILGASDFYAEISNYLNDMKKRLEKDTKLEDYQMFTVDPEFYEKFKKAFEEFPRKAEKRGGQYRITFGKHEEIDDFVNVLLSIDGKFKENYVGKWILLKAFDRSYVMREKKDPGNESCVASDKGCPFSKRIIVKEEEVFDFSKSV